MGAPNAIAEPASEPADAETMAASPSSDSPTPAKAAVPTLSVDNLSVEFPVRQGGLWGRHRSLRAVDGVSFTVRPGETVGLVGESGSGKTTIGRAVLRRVAIAEGRVVFQGRDITGLRGETMRRLRAHMQVVLQDPYASLNPRQSVGEIVAEPLIVHGRVRSISEAMGRVRELLALVGLPQDAAERFPHAFSGGQRQRVGIARALALEPALVVADEPVSALDVSVRAQVVNLMQDLQERLGLAYLFIAHDLAVVRHICHRVAILYAGRIVELAPREAIYDRPLHPYTELLLASVPVPDPVVQRPRVGAHPAAGERPDLLDPPPGCRFNARCPLATERCRAETPPLREVAPDRLLACWHRG